MPYRVFLSHSVQRGDYSLVTSVANHLLLYGIDVHIPDWYPKYGTSVHKYVAAQIEDSDLVLVVVTSNTSRPTSVACEVGFAQDRGKPVVALVEEGVNTEGFLDGLPRLTFERWGPEAFYQSAKTVVEHISQLREEKAQREKDRKVLIDVAGVALAGLFFWLLSQGGKEK